MKNIFKKILTTAGMIISISILIIPSIAFATFYTTGAGTYYTQGGISTTATTIYLSSFKEPISGVPYTMSYLNSSVEYAVIDPLQPNRSEFISFTGITQNTDGSAIITGVTRGLSRSYPFTASTTIAQTHAAQAQFILSDTPQLFTEYPAKQNNETITGAWSFPSPTSSSSPATQAYVLQTISGTSTLTFNQTSVQGNASGTVSKGNIVSFDAGSHEWVAAKASSTNSNNSNSAYTQIGIAQGAATNGQSIPGGILVKGLDSTQLGLSAGLSYFLSTSSAGSLTTATTSTVVGQALSATTIYLDPYFLLNSSLQSDFTTVGKNVKVFTGPLTSTFSVPTGVYRINVQLVGAGGGGQSAAGTPQGGGGGGSGGYCNANIDTSSTSTISFTLGAGGPAGVTQVTASSSTFGPYITATGGQTGGTSGQVFGIGGVGGTATTSNVLSSYCMNGNSGSYGMGVATITFSGAGGGTIFGPGGASVAGPGTAGPGTTSSAYGSGGSGSIDGYPGGTGAPGALIITW